MSNSFKLECRVRETSMKSSSEGPWDHGQINKGTRYAVGTAKPLTTLEQNIIQGFQEDESISSCSVLWRRKDYEWKT